MPRRKKYIIREATERVKSKIGEPDIVKGYEILSGELKKPIELINIRKVWKSINNVYRVVYEVWSSQTYYLGSKFTLKKAEMLVKKYYRIRRRFEPKMPSLTRLPSMLDGYM